MDTAFGYGSHAITMLNPLDLDKHNAALFLSKLSGVEHSSAVAAVSRRNLRVIQLSSPFIAVTNVRKISLLLLL